MMARSIAYLLGVLLSATNVPVQADGVSGVAIRIPSKGENSMIQRIPVGDVELAWRVYGDNETNTPLLMITGYGGLMDMWPRSLIDVLARDRRVIVFDNRGMGYSGSSETDYSIVRFAEDTHALLAALGVGRAHVLGWSMGSFIAQELALRYPQQVARLVLIAGSCGGSEAHWPPDAVWTRLLDLSGTLEVRVQRMFENLFPPDWLAATPDPLQVFPPITAPVDDAHLFRQGQTLRAWPGVCERLASIRAETLLITGTEDLVIPPANAWLIAERVPDASLIQVRGGGHGVFYQEPARIAGYLSAFLGGD